MPRTLKQQSVRLKNWIVNAAIPLWSRTAINPNNGAHFERLLPNGLVDVDSDMRIRVQARQTFFFASAAHLGWYKDGKQIAEGIMTFVEKNGKHPSAGGGYIRSFNKHYQIADTSQDLYDCAFILLANAWLFKLDSSPQTLKRAEEMLAHIDKKFGSKYGGWDEGDHDYICRRQNPHMHLFEAFLALYEATNDAKWLARVGEIFILFQTYFYDSKQQVLFEFFEDDWSHCKDAKGKVVEPGHLMEWVWLLDWYHRVSGRPVKYYTDILFKRGIELGLDESGMLYDSVAANGDILDANKRCWGITEFIKACLVQVRAGDPKAEIMAINAVDTLFKYYLCTSQVGSYIEHRDENNDVLVNHAPATTLYHIMMAAIELDKHCFPIVKS